MVCATASMQWGSRRRPEPRASEANTRPHSCSRRLGADDFLGGAATGPIGRCRGDRFLQERSSGAATRGDRNRRDRSRDAAWRHDRSAWNAIVRPPQPGRPLSPFRRRASRESKGDEARARVGRDRRRSGRSPPPNTEGDGGPRSADDPRARRWTLHRYHPGPGRHRVRPAYRRLTGLAHRSPTVLPAPAAEWSPSATAPACSSANGSPPAVSRPDAG